MKLGFIITGYDRYPMLLTSLMSLSACNFKDTLFVLVDDCSPDKRIKERWNEFSEYQNTKGNHCIFVQSEEHQGLPGLSKLKRLGITQCNDMDFIVFVPDDVIYNPFFYESILKATKWKADAVCFMEDTRGPLFGIDHVKKQYDGYQQTTHVDGFGVMMSIQTVKKLDWNVNEKQARETGRSLIWRSISHQLRGNIVATDESLIEHVGNLYNATLKKEKAGEKKIYAENLNLFRRPTWID